MKKFDKILLGTVGGLLALAAVTISFAGPAVDGTATSTRTTTTTTTTSSAWMDGKYSPSVKLNIDNSTNCAELQTMFDNADANDAATRARTGSGTVDLMTYIDSHMRNIGCYN